MMTCIELDGLITPFVDDVCSPRERAAIVTHLQQCDACRSRVEAEAAARNILRAHAAIGRAMDASPSWRPRVFRLGQPALPAHPKLLLALAVICAGMAGWWLRPAPVVAVGLIGDSFCQRNHRLATIFNVGDRECTLGCVKAGAEFVLVSDREVYRIRNQKMPELALFANRRVQVRGRMKDGRIVVAKLTAADAATPRALQ
jgi:hypothetical protein